jgi:hypothetical protein
MVRFYHVKEIGAVHACTMCSDECVAFGGCRAVLTYAATDAAAVLQGSGTPQLLTVPAKAAAAAAAASSAAESATCCGGATRVGAPLEALLAAAAPGAVTLYDDSGLPGAENAGTLQWPVLNLWCVCKAPQLHWQQQQPERQQQQLVLAAGEELYISYVARCDAMTAYLNFGFVPPEQQ